jgi:hypothetical protein
LSSSHVIDLKETINLLNWVFHQSCVLSSVRVIALHFFISNPGHFRIYVQNDNSETLQESQIQNKDSMIFLRQDVKKDISENLLK